MDTARKSNHEPWLRRYGRDELLSPKLWAVVGCLYAATFLLVAALMFLLAWVVPHLPWISKPYISPDPPPLDTALRCANFVLGFIAILLPILFVVGPKRQILISRPRKDRHTTKT